MIASNVTADTLARAAEEVGVEIDMRPLSASGRRHRVKVNPHKTPGLYTPSGRRRRGENGDAKYQRESASYFSAGRRAHAVCWHGFRDFFRAVYKLEPDAVFRTALDTWRGSADFEARFRMSGHRNIGSQAMPISAAEACRCPDSGYAG